MFAAVSLVEANVAYLDFIRDISVTNTKGIAAVNANVIGRTVADPLQVASAIFLYFIGHGTAIAVPSLGFFWRKRHTCQIALNSYSFYNGPRVAAGWSRVITLLDR